MFFCWPDQALIYAELSKSGDMPKIYYYDKSFRL